MFREMRRKKQALSREESIAILERGISGTLAVNGDNGYPYAVPVNYVYSDGKIYFHGAKAGHKIDSILKNDKVSFCVVDQDLIVPEEYTSYFRSAIVFGRARILTDPKEIMDSVGKLAARYSPDETPENRHNYIEKHSAPLCMIELTIEHISGKEAVELMRENK